MAAVVRSYCRNVGVIGCFTNYSLVIITLENLFQLNNQIRQIVVDDRLLNVKVDAIITVDQAIARRDHLQQGSSEY